MAISNKANLGVNTSGNQQAIVRVTAEGCLTQTLAELLQANLVIEFPSEVLEDGRVDVLSANALNQITEQLAGSEVFKDLVTEVVTDPAVLEAIVEAINENPGFIEDEEKRLVLVGSSPVVVDDGLKVFLLVPAASEFVFTYSFSDAAGVDVSESYIWAQTPNAVTLALRNATAGQSVTLNWNRVLIE